MEIWRTRGIAIQESDLTRRSYVTHYTSLDFDGYPPAFKTKEAFERGAYLTQHGGYVFNFLWALELDAPKLPSWKRVQWVSESCKACKVEVCSAGACSTMARLPSMDKAPRR